MSLLFAVFLTLACSSSPADPPETCMEQTTIKLGEEDFVVTLPEAERIRSAVTQFLAAEDPPMDEKVPRPSEAFIDCWGTVRMGVWILERSSDEPQFRLTHRIVDNDLLIVREEIRIERAGDGWKAVSRGQVIYHRKRDP